MKIFVLLFILTPVLSPALAFDIPQQNSDGKRSKDSNTKLIIKEASLCCPVETETLPDKLSSLQDSSDQDCNNPNHSNYFINLAFFTQHRTASISSPSSISQKTLRWALRRRGTAGGSSTVDRSLDTPVTIPQTKDGRPNPTGKETHPSETIEFGTSKWRIALNKFIYPIRRLFFGESTTSRFAPRKEGFVYTKNPAGRTMEITVLYPPQIRKILSKSLKRFGLTTEHNKSPVIFDGQRREKIPNIISTEEIAVQSPSRSRSEKENPPEDPAKVGNIADTNLKLLKIETNPISEKDAVGLFGIQSEFRKSKSVNNGDGEMLHVRLASEVDDSSSANTPTIKPSEEQQRSQTIWTDIRPEHIDQGYGNNRAGFLTYLKSHHLTEEDLEKVINTLLEKKWSKKISSIEEKLMNLLLLQDNVDTAKKYFAMNSNGEGSSHASNNYQPSFNSEELKLVEQYKTAGNNQYDSNVMAYLDYKNLEEKNLPTYIEELKAQTDSGKLMEEVSWLEGSRAQAAAKKYFQISGAEHFEDESDQLPQTNRKTPSEKDKEKEYDIKHPYGRAWLEYEKLKARLDHLKNSVKKTDNDEEQLKSMEKDGTVEAARLNFVKLGKQPALDTNVNSSPEASAKTSLLTRSFRKRNSITQSTAVTGGNQTLAAARAAYLDALSAFRAAQTNASATILPIIDGMLGKNTSSYLWGAAWSIYTELTASPQYLVGPYTMGLTHINWFEQQVFSSSNTTLENLVAKSGKLTLTELSQVKLMLTAQTLATIYQDTYQRCVAALEAKGILADMVTLARYLQPEDDSVVPASMKKVSADPSVNYWTRHINMVAPSDGWMDEFITPGGTKPKGP